MHAKTAQETLSLIPKGTQVVTLVTTKGLNQNRFHPRGAVGVIVMQPQDETHSYLIEFSDRTQTALKRQDFAVKKLFECEPVAPKTLKDLGLDKYVIYRCVVGSRAYGLENETSDTDLRGIYLPPANLHWSLQGVPEQLENKETEECYWELQKFLTLALKANPNILECLNTPIVLSASFLTQELLSIRQIFLSKLVYQTYNGYVFSQFKKLEQDLRTRNEIRPKHAMHLIRLLLQGIDILRAGELNVRVSDYREELLAIKRGEMNWEEINNWRLALHKEFDRELATTKLPERPNYEKANEFLIKARRTMV